MEKLNIAIFTDSFTPLRDGIVTSTINLAKRLADNGHKVYIIAPKYNGIKEFSYLNIVIKRIFGVPALFYPGFKITSIFSLKILRFLKKEKIDLIHFQTPFTLGVQAILLAKYLKKPLVGTFHTFITDQEYIKHMKLQGKFIEKLSWIYVRKYYNKCDLITCPTKSARNELLKNNFTKPIKVISNGVDFSIFKSTNSKRINKKGGHKRKNLLFIGRIAYEKNLNYLLDCFQLILKEDPTIKLTIVGDGPQMHDIKKQISQRKLSSNIILTGRIEHDQLAESSIFNSNDLFITASMTESQGISTLEAQSNGLVCVGINSKGIKNTIKNNYNGYLIKEGNKKEFANKVLKLIQDERLYKKMRENTLEEIKKHDIRNVVKLFVKEYSSLILKKNQ